MLLIHPALIGSLLGLDEKQRIINSIFHVICPRTTTPNTILLDPVLLKYAKSHFDSKNETNAQVSQKLILEANTFLLENATSVVNKNRIPPSGDKHDFLSLSPYRWPDPSKPNGVPYVFHDGKINPETYTIPDKRNLDDMIYRVKTLSLAYYFTENHKYASKATELLHVWFLNNGTHMNPNLRYAEIVPGKDKVNPSGIMAGTYISDILDSIGLIQCSASWTNQDQRGIEIWFTRYLDWLLHSEAVGEEIQKINNHGTYYDVQVSSIALFLNQTSIAKSVIQSARQDLTPMTISEIPNLIAVKIQPDGRQPFELQRSKSLDYSMFNLLGLFKLASIGQHIGIDLWNYKTNQGAGLKKALDYLIPFIFAKQKWPYQQIKPIRTEYLVDLLCQATIHYPNDTSYLQMYKSLNKEEIPADIDNYHVCLAPFNLIKETDPGSVEEESPK